MGDDFGKVGGGGIGVGGAEESEKPERLLLDKGFGIGGGLIEAIEEDGDAGVGREILDEIVEVVNGDLVGVAVGELGEGGQNALLELHHREVSGDRRGC